VRDSIDFRVDFVAGFWKEKSLEPSMWFTLTNLEIFQFEKFEK
jgi:hypothetical protein